MRRAAFQATSVAFNETSMFVRLLDGRTLGVPLAWFPRLLQANPQQRTRYRISPRGLHWDELDEDISIAGLLAGQSDMTYRRSRIA